MNTLIEKAKRPLEKINQSIFQGVHSNNLIYNTCWELERRRAYFGLWSYFLYIGKIRQ